MNKKSLLLATLLAGMNVFSGGEKKPEKRGAVLKDTQTQRFEKMAESIPIFCDELPHAMILDDGKGGCVQMLYPAKRDGSILEDKDQYEKRVKWLNAKCPIEIPQPHLTLKGCKWIDYLEPPKSPYVSIFDKKEYIYHHINWMKGFYKPGNRFNVDYSPEKDPLVGWWITQTTFHKLFEEQGNRKVSGNVVKER